MITNNTYQFPFPQLIGNKHRQNFGWQSKLITKSSKPDKKLIELAELAIYWNKSPQIIDATTIEKKFIHKFPGNTWQTSYAYLAQKLKCSKDTIRRKLVKLEALNIIRQEFRSVYLNDEEHNNRLFIRLNDDFLELAIGSKKIPHSLEEDSFNQKWNFPPPKNNTPIHIDINSTDYELQKSKHIKRSKFVITQISNHKANTKTKNIKDLDVEG